MKYEVTHVKGIETNDFKLRKKIQELEKSSHRKNTPNYCKLIVNKHFFAKNKWSVNFSIKIYVSAKTYVFCDVIASATSRQNKCLSSWKFGIWNKVSS